MAVFIGTSGWAYPEWKERNGNPGFYPAGLSSIKWLEHYSRLLSACEINATFRQTHSEETFGRWARSTPEGFRFAIKAHRRLTHVKRITPEGPQLEFLNDFLRTAGILGHRLGMLLFQFPPTRKRDDDDLLGLLNAIPDTHRCAFEFRHDSWDHPQVRELIASRNAAAVVSESAGAPPTPLPPGPHAYVRLRASKYSPKARKAWRESLENEGAKRDIYLFTKHEGADAGNTYAGVGLAQWLTRKTSPPAHRGRGSDAG